VSVAQRSMIRISEKETVELQDWHPTPSAHMDSANDNNLAGPDAAFPDVPLRVGRPGIWLAVL
jgi:hypothetical protein